MLSPSVFESAFNSSPIGKYLLSPTPDSVILAVNDAFLIAASRRREDLLGVSLFVAFPSDPNDPDSTNEAELRASLALVRETGQPDTLPVQRYPIPIRHPDGSTGFEERFWSAYSAPVFDADGSLICIAHTTKDVTEQIRSERALRESENRFRALTTAGQVVYRMNADWTELRELDGRGFLKDSAGPHPFWLRDYIPADEQERVHAAVLEAIKAGAVYELEHRVRRLDGSDGWALSRAVPICDAHGEVIEWIGAASDISERKAAEEKLRESDRRKDEFLAMLAHELRNPIAPISAAAELLQRMKPDEALVRRTSQIIARQVRHMTGLIDDLLDVSRVTRGLVELEQAPLDLREVLHDAVEQVTPLVRARDHELVLALPDQPMLVMGDRKRLVQVVANLLNNAAKYTPEGGILTASAGLRDALACIEVRDNGIGMAPELTQRVFDLFAQAERSADRAMGGLGLGLALVKSLVELHGGTVACDSPGLGQGSRFTACLPCLAGATQPAAAPGDVAVVAAAQAAAPLRVLVVDDNVDAAITLAMLLGASGHQVLVEHGAQAALDTARRSSPAVCLLDVGLPEMDGKELARRLRAEAGTANALLVAVTGYGQESDREQILAAGFDHHLVKPVDMGQLEAILAAVA
ncbi:PAS domain-containing hybrid sensor histidine kinase/response regulator [Massilia yuzhufengensis]|uniref:histidine kinase n=1 Tax=Massilia yuzhufengensis TaxID=1164594 RepID=A0A1I1GZD6_9BURK|nr:ATP-binding protein [Massilia yuzhufengensis]SFC14533.1 PAS domain S-box-containing protein [Massilia yuzhufengensis]